MRALFQPATNAMKMQQVAVRWLLGNEARLVVKQTRTAEGEKEESEELGHCCTQVDEVDRLGHVIAEAGLDALVMHI